MTDISTTPGDAMTEAAVSDPVELAHRVDWHVPRRYPDPFCNSRHPIKGNACRRMVGHDGDHSAFIYSIAVPETWPPVPVLVDVDNSDEEGAQR